MSRVLCLAPSGFGKTTGIGAIPEYGLLGLPPEKTYVISVTSKPLPFRGSARMYPVTTVKNLKGGKRVITNRADEIASVLEQLLPSPFQHIVLDDTNYIMQDHYMDNALKTGWDTPKKIGFDMNKIFKAMEKYQTPEKNIFVLAHGEDVAKPDGRIYVKMKTTGKMVDEYVTPEGKFEITLIGKSFFDSNQKKVIKQYVTNEDENYSSAKSPIGMFEELYIPNDLGLVAQKIQAYYLGDNA
jgi:hypothetical protein